jgi:hypothetical protein
MIVTAITSQIARPHETSGYELPHIFLSKKGHVQKSPQKERKHPKKQKIMRKQISRKK